MARVFIFALIGFAVSGIDGAFLKSDLRSNLKGSVIAFQPTAEADEAGVTVAAGEGGVEYRVDYKSWGVGIGIGCVVGAILAVVAMKFAGGAPAKDAEEGEAAPVEEGEAAPVAAAAVEVAEDTSKATDYQQLLMVLAQKVAQEVGPKVSKAGAVKNVLDSRMSSFADKTKSFLLNEMNGTAGAVLRELDAPEAMMLLDWNHAVEANFPPTSILLAGFLSPTLLNVMSVHHIIQLVSVGLPMLILCICALYIDWNAPCAIPSIFQWLFTQTALAALLVIGHGVLALKIAMGKKTLATKAAELNAQHQDEETVTDLRDQFVNNTVVLQESLLVENDIRHSFWNSIVGVCTLAWVITTIWNLVLICGWTFVPGIVAFHPDVAHSPDYCGAWMTVLVLRINMLLAVLFLFMNLGTVIQWGCDMMIENEGFQTSMIKKAQDMDNNASGLPVMELLVKAFLLRGGSDTLNSRLAVVQGNKAKLEKEKAALAATLAALDYEITSVKTEEDTLKDNAKAQGGNLAEQIIKMESQASLVVEDAEAMALQVQEETTKALEELMEKIMEVYDAAANSEITKMMSAKFNELEQMGEKAIAAAKDPEKQKELMEEMKQAMEKAQQAAQDVAAAASDPVKRAELQAEATKMMEQAKQAAHAAADGLTDPKLQEQMKQAAKDAMAHAKEAAEEAVEQAKVKVEEAKEKTAPLAAQAKAKAEEAVEQAKAAANK